MSERPSSSTASEEDDETVTPARLRAAAALRTLGHAVVSREVDDSVLTRLAEAAEGLLPEVEAGSARARPVDVMKRRLYEHAPDDGEGMDHFPDCIVSGLANPMGVAIRVHREGDEAVARVALGAAFEGAPGRAHGGIVAAIFDDAMGFVLSMIETPAFTGRLTISYLAPTPIHTPVEFRCRLRERAGRKLFMDGVAWSDGQLLAEAEGVFITIPPERFAATAPG